MGLERASLLNDQQEPRERGAARQTTLAAAWTLAGQGTTFISLVVFARLGGPRPLGYLAAGSSVVALLNTFSTVGVEFILPVARPGQLSSLYRRGAVALSLSTVATGTVGVFLSSFVGQPRWVGLAVAGGVLAVALGQVLGAAVIRFRRVVLVGVYRFVTAVAVALAQFGVIAIIGADTAWGLFAGYVMGTAVTSALFAARVFPSLRTETRERDIVGACPWPLHIQAAAASLLNVAALQGPAIIWPSVLGARLAGQWALVMRVVSAPISLASGPVANTVNADFAYLIRNGDRGALLTSLAAWRRRLAVYSLATGAAAAGVIWILPSLLGGDWSGTRALLPFALLYAVPQCAISPTGQILNLIARSVAQLVWDLARLTVVAIALVVFARGYGALAAYSCVMAGFYIVLYRITVGELAAFVKRA